MGYEYLWCTNRTRSLAVVPIALLLSGSCSPHEAAFDPPTCELRGQALYGATNTGDALWPQESAEGIGFLALRDAGATGAADSLCTFTRVAPGRGLTAAHCFETMGQEQAWVGFAELALLDPNDPCTANDAQRIVSVRRHRRHPKLDIAMLEFDEAPGISGRSWGFTPRTLRTGEAVWLAGYGLREDGSYGARHFAPTTVITGDAEFWTVGSAGQNGACVGDSGGPLLVGAPEHGYQLAGVLSQGSASCRGNDQFTAVGAFQDWLNSALK